MLLAEERRTLLDLANLSLGGTARNCLEQMNPALLALAGRIAAALHLSFCGIDLFIADLRDPASPYQIIEVNSAPGLDDSVFTGPAQGSRVDDLYLRVFVAMERRAALLGRDQVDP